jgi:hypothetical protein
MMRKQKQKRLRAKGWKVGTVKQFLGLSNEEAAYIELKIKLAAGLRQRRQQKGLSQLDLAAKLQSSQSRVAKMAAGDPSGSLDLLIRSLIFSGHNGARAITAHHDPASCVATAAPSSKKFQPSVTVDLSKSEKRQVRTTKL